MHSGIKQDSMSGELALLAYLDCWQVCLHLTLSRHVILGYGLKLKKLRTFLQKL